jgi:hypothetical protein
MDGKCRIKIDEDCTGYDDYDCVPDASCTYIQPDEYACKCSSSFYGMEPSEDRTRCAGVMLDTSFLLLTILLVMAKAFTQYQ